MLLTFPSITISRIAEYARQGEPTPHIDRKHGATRVLAFQWLPSPPTVRNNCGGRPAPITLQKTELWRSEAPEAVRARGLAEPEVLVRLALPLPI